MIISIIVAMDQRGGIGLKNRLPWHLPDDLKHFKQLTMGHHVIVGRKTFEAIGKPLRGRKMIVLSRHLHVDHTVELRCASSLELALQICRQAKETETFIAGGAEVFRLALPYASRMYLTRVLAVVEADTFFPSWDEREWEILTEIDHPADTKHAYPFLFIELQKR
ncbi:MAG: dihydrofolate reductase [Anaerolineales bacterium]